MKGVKIRVVFMFLGSFCLSFCSDAELRKNKDYEDTFQKELRKKYKDYQVTFQKEYKCAAVMKDEELVINEEGLCTLVFDLYRMKGVFFDMVTVKIQGFIGNVKINPYGFSAFNFRNLEFNATNYKNFHDVCRFNVELNCRAVKEDIFEFYIFLCQNNPKKDRKGYSGTLVICEPLKIKLVRKPSVVVDKKDDKVIKQEVINECNSADQDVIKNSENVNVNIIKEENAWKNINNVENLVTVNQAIKNDSDIHKIEQPVLKDNQMCDNTINVDIKDTEIDKNINNDLELKNIDVSFNHSEIINNDKRSEVLLSDVNIKNDVLEDRNDNKPINSLNYENIIYEQEDKDKNVIDKVEDYNVEKIIDENENMFNTNARCEGLQNKPDSASGVKIVESKSFKNIDSGDLSGIGGYNKVLKTGGCGSCRPR